MEPPSPARLYATAAGAFLVVVGILGFFYTASFGSPGSVAHELGLLRVNGWLNLLHIATGALALLLAGVAARRCSLALGTLYTALAILGWAIGSGDAIFGFIPAAGGDEALRLVLGLLGLAAAAATPHPRSRRKRLPPPFRRSPRPSRGSSAALETTKEPRSSEARAKIAGKRA